MKSLLSVVWDSTVPIPAKMNLQVEEYILYRSKHMERVQNFFTFVLSSPEWEAAIVQAGSRAWLLKYTVRNKESIHVESTSSRLRWQKNGYRSNHIRLMQQWSIDLVSARTVADCTTAGTARPLACRYIHVRHPPISWNHAAVVSLGWRRRSRAVPVTCKPEGLWTMAITTSSGQFGNKCAIVRLNNSWNWKKNTLVYREHA